jgi:hypothetical protein
VRDVRGFARVLVGEKVMVEAQEGKEPTALQTSTLHSGKDSPVAKATGAGDVPKREKERLVLATTGDPLSHRSSLLQFFKAMYDVVQSASLDLFSLE